MITSQHELIAKVATYVDRDFGADYDSAFSAYDEDGDGRLTMKELNAFLKHSGAGGQRIVGEWTKSLLEQLDPHNTGFVTRVHFNKVFDEVG